MTRISRRSFLRASAGATAAAALVACGETKQRAAPTGVASATPAASAVTSRGGILRVYNFDALSPDSFDPHLTRGGPIANLHSAIFSRLLRYEDDARGTVAPDLAESLPEQPDETTYIFTLRSGVRFHDSARARLLQPQLAGRALSASDVQFSLERQMSRSRGSLQFLRQDQFGVIDRLEVPEERRIVVHLKRPVAPFLAFLAAWHAAIVPQEALDRSRGEVSGDGGLVGTGPFMLDSYETGRAAILRRNPSWFAADDDADGWGGGRPFLDGYDAFFSPQHDQFQREAFTDRHVDATGFAEPLALDHARKTNLADIRLEEARAAGVLASRLLVDRAPFRDDRARRAVHLAVDRRSLRDLLYPPMDASASAELSGPVAPGMTRWAVPSEELERRAGYRADRDADLAEARQLWSAAGMAGEQHDLPVLVSGVPRVLAERGADALQRQLREALGLNLHPAVDPTGGAYISAALRLNLEGATEGFAGFTFGLEEGGVDLDDWLYGQFHSGEPANTYRLEDSTLDAQLEKQRVTFDEEERRALGHAIQDYLLANVNARIEYVAPVLRRLSWGYVRNAHFAAWHGGDDRLADTWLDTSHPAWAARPT